MLPDKFKEDRFERSSTPSKNDQLLVSHCRPLVQRMHFYLKTSTICCPYIRRAAGLMDLSELDLDLRCCSGSGLSPSQGHCCFLNRQECLLTLPLSTKVYKINGYKQKYCLG